MELLTREHLPGSVINNVVSLSYSGELLIEPCTSLGGGGGGGSVGLWLF